METATQAVGGRRAVFLDLQGTLGGEGLGDVRHFESYPFAPAAVRLINDAGLLAVVVTNQSHISKGLLTYDEYESRRRTIEAKLVEEGGHFDGFYCCPHSGADRCQCRKPRPGLVHKAALELGIDVSRSYVVGDMGSSDMLLAHAVEAKGILVRTGVGEGSLGEYRRTWAQVEPAHVADNVLASVQWILQQ